MEPRTRRAFRGRILHRAARLVSFAVRVLPLNVARRIGGFLGLLGWHLLRSERRKALANIAIAFPEWDAARRAITIRAMFRHLGLCLSEILWLPNVDVAVRDRTTTVEGVEPILAALRAGRGMIMITAHCGNWEWMAYAFALFGSPMSVLQRERDEAELNQLITEIRAGAGIRTIDRGSSSAARQMIQALRSGGALAFLIDQSVRVESVPVPFFGREALTPIGPAKLAIRTETPIVIGFIERRNGHQFIHFQPVIETARGDDPVALTARLTASIEEQIRRVPEQWVWMHDRWRQRPQWDVTRRTDPSPLESPSPPPRGGEGAEGG